MQLLITIPLVLAVVVQPVVDLALSAQADGALDV